MPEADLFQEPWNFIGLRDEVSSADARAWVLPVPYEGTTTFGGGTRRGPEAIIAASREVELFDREFDRECALEYGVHTLPPLAVTHASPEAMADRVERAVTEVLTGSPAPELLCLLGGEHTISVGAVRAVAKAREGLATESTENTELGRPADAGSAERSVPSVSSVARSGGRGSDDLVCVQIDAHADLRDEYEGTRHSHACAARRVLETCPVFQIGVRNVSREEEEFRLEELRTNEPRLWTVFAEEATAEPPAFLDELSEFVQGKAVYLTIDIDGLDPSIMPATGTPEPGGLSWARTLDVVRTVVQCAASVPAFDLVELAPVPGLGAPDFLCAKLVYKIMSLALLR